MFLVALVLALATPAQAGTMKFASDCSVRYYCTHSATYTAAPGERNDVEISRPEAGVVVIHDAGAPVSGCTAVDPHTARCTAPASEGLFVDALLGDGDDAARAYSASVDGGPGDDVIFGEYARLTGGPGSDRLTAGPGGASFGDGDGKTPAPDRYEGSPTGEDMLGYGGRRAGLRIDLRRPGRVAEDYMANIDHAAGGDGDDVLIGTDGPNRLYGGPGTDRIRGLGGNDELYNDVDHGGAFVEAPVAGDVLDGGGGDDTLQINTIGARGAHQLRCGAGRDTVSQVLARDSARPDCEVLWLGESTHEVRLRPRARVFLRDPHEPGPYVVRAATGEVVARGRHALRLNALGRRLLAQRGRLRITLRVRDRDGSVYGFRTELQRPM